MEKDESFIIMGGLLGVLLLIVVALVLIIRPSKERVYDKEVVKDTQTDVKRDYSYEKININNRVSYTNDEITVTYAKESSGSNTLFYQTEYANFYLVGYNLGDVRVSSSKVNTTLKAALDENLISIYDAKTAMGDSVVEEERYEITFGDYITKTIHLGSFKIHYDDAKKIFISIDGGNAMSLSDAIKKEINKTDVINILRYKAGNGEYGAYKLEDGESYLFETRDNRIFICNTKKNKDIYIGSLNLDYDCK